MIGLEHDGHSPRKPISELEKPVFDVSRIKGRLRNGHANCAPTLRYGYQGFTSDGMNWQYLGNPIADQRYDTWQNLHFGLTRQGLPFAACQHSVAIGATFVRVYR